ncbi:MAG: S53 family peptidase, partial [Polyangiaceae bacterium]
GQNVTLMFQTGFPPAAQQPHGQQQLSGYITPAMAAAPLVGPVPASTVIRLAIGLPIQNKAQLEAFIQSVSDPTSPTYRQYISPSAYASRYGASASDLANVVAFGNTNGLSFPRAYPDGLLVDISGPASAVEQALYLNLNYYLRPDGSQFFSTDRDPSLDLATTVLRISGLNNALLAMPGGVAANHGSAPEGSFTPFDLRNAYVPCAGTLLGTGQTVGLLECDGFLQSDITQFQTDFNSAGSMSFGSVGIVPNTVLVDGFDGNPRGGNFQLEVTADIELVNALAPGAQITSFEAGGDDDSILDTLHTMANTTPLINQFSSSWFFDTDDNTNQVMDQFAAQGQSFFFSSGDNGAYPGGTLFTSYLPYVTVVGGTDLGMELSSGVTCSPFMSPCSYLFETAWNSGGGGILNLGATLPLPFQQFPYNTGGFPFPSVPLPTYQSGIDMIASGGSTVFRNVPDVSTVAVNTLAVSNGVSVPFSGTSASSPLWAAFIALANQQTQGLAFHGAVGFANPVLYTIGKAQFLNPSGFNGLAFNDVTSGSNDHGARTGVYTAVPGYDLATGWGSPQCGLINQLASQTPAVPFSCGAGVSVCGLACCPSGICNAGACAPLPTFAIDVNITAKQIDGDQLCVTGTGFTPNVPVTIVLDGIPDQLPVQFGTRADATGAFSFDEPVVGTITCSAAQGMGTTTVTAIDGTASPFKVSGGWVHQLHIALCEIDLA